MKQPSPGRAPAMVGPDWVTRQGCFAVLALAACLLVAALLQRRRRRARAPVRLALGLQKAPVALRAAQPSQESAQPSQESFEGAPSRADEEEEVPASEWASVEELRQRVQRSALADKLPGGTRWYEDYELLRFVRGKDSIDEAERLFNEAMAWRAQHLKQRAAEGAPTMAAGSFGAEFRSYENREVEPPLWWSFLRAKLPQVLYGADRSGLPVLYCAPGHSDLSGCAREVGVEALECYAVMINDRFLDIAREKDGGRRSGPLGGAVIINLEGLGWRHLRDVGLFRRLGTAAKFLHPERQRKCFVVNAPSTFAAVWKLVRPVLDPRTAARMHIFDDGDSFAPLLAEVGEENVPTFLGGTWSGWPRPRAPVLRAGSFVTFQNAQGQ